MMYSIHSPADSLIHSSAFHTKESLSPPSTPGRKRSYCFPDGQFLLSPMPEFLSSNGSILHSLVHSNDNVMKQEDIMLTMKEQQARQRERLSNLPLPTFVLQPRSESTKVKMEVVSYHHTWLDDTPPLLYSDVPLNDELTHIGLQHRMVFTDALPRLPSLSEHNDVEPSIANDTLEHVRDEMSIDETNGNENTKKLPTFKRKGVKRKEQGQGEEDLRKSVVARCA